MKQEQRAIYKTLISLPEDGYGLCNICRFAEWEGYSCEDMELTCHCGIYIIEDQADGFCNNCWAFRPRWLLEDIVDMVGLLLRGMHPDMSKCQEFVPKKLRGGE